MRFWAVWGGQQEGEHIDYHTPGDPKGSADIYILRGRPPTWINVFACLHVQQNIVLGNWTFFFCYESTNRILWAAMLVCSGFISDTFSTLWSDILVVLGPIWAALYSLWVLDWVSKTFGYHFQRFRSFLTRSLGTLGGVVWLHNCQKSRPETQKRWKNMTVLRWFEKVFLDENILNNESGATSDYFRFWTKIVPKDVP